MRSDPYSLPDALNLPKVAQAKRSKVRFVVLSLLATGTFVNYLDRTVLGIAAPLLSKDLHLGPATMGLVFSAFAWTYAAAQIPAGLVLDRFGTRVTYCLAVFFWSFCTLLQGLSRNLSWLLTFRLGLGVSESPCFPTCSRAVTTWFPQQERATATGVYTLGEYVGLAFFSPVLFYLRDRFGWHSLFYFVGMLGIFFSLAWWLLYREPHQSTTVNQAELDYISAGGGLVHTTSRSAPFQWGLVWRLVRKRQLAGVCLGQFGSNSMLVFFLTWFPTFLATDSHVAGLNPGFITVLPFLAASAGTLFGGWLSDALLRSGHTVNLSRKLPILSGLLLASTIVLVNFCHNSALVITILSLAFFAQGMAALGWAVVSDIAVDGHLGICGGIFSFVSNIAGITTPLILGIIVARTGTFVYGFVYIGSAALLGALSYIFLVGDIKRIVLTDIP